MNLDLDDDQVALRDGISALLDGRFGTDRVRAGYDRAMHDELAEAGVFSLLADGFTYADAVVVFEQLGEFVVPGPLVATFLAAGLDGFDGTSTAVPISHVEPGASSHVYVEHPDVIERVLVIADSGASMVERAALQGSPVTWPLDPLTPLLRVDTLPAGAPSTDAEVTQLRLRGAVLTAAYAVGMASRLTELSVAYAKERQQFDRIIGSFQAIKHLLADMAVRTEVARAAVYAAGAALAEPGSEDVARAASVAKVVAGEAAIVNGKTATQVHGGMGFTWEVDVHLYLKRAWLLDTHFGSTEHHCVALSR
ncbi:MAG TPA: acyl-CoA dehydrogenase family protein [Acidimicrobiia bacterium]|jgi:alkylation response protein AidB-like acyl-CoA dehydrogenase